MAKKKGAKKVVRTCTCTDVENMADHGVVSGGENKGKRILICLRCKMVRIV